MRWLSVLFAVLALSSVLLGAAEPAVPPALDPKTARDVQNLNRLADNFHGAAGDYTQEERQSRGERVNQAFVALTGEAINPLFGITTLGIYNYFRTPEAYRAALPLHDQPIIWIPLLAIILLMLFNSTICEAIPPLKIPLNALGDLVNKAGAVAVLPLVVKMFADSVAYPAAGGMVRVANALFPVAQAAEGSAGGTLWLSLGWLAGAAAGLIVYLAVWMTFNVVDVLIIVCPFPGVDALLKSFRLSMIGVLAGSYQLSPGIAFVLAAAICAVSFVMAGWSFRLSVFGWIFSTDIIFFRRRRLADAPVTAFAAVGLRGRRGTPLRTLGRLEKGDDGDLVFSYRPWLIFGRRRVVLGKAGDFSGGRGLVNPFLVADAAPDCPLLRLPPRYRGCETELVRFFGLHRTVDCGMGGSLRSWLAAQFGGSGAATA